MFDEKDFVVISFPAVDMEMRMLVCDRLLLLGVSMMIDLWLNLMAWNVYEKTMGRIIIERDATHCLMCVLMTVVMVCV